MTIVPQQNYILIRMKDLSPPKAGLVLHERSTQVQPYGEVISVGPDCEIVKPLDAVLFLPANIVAGFDEHDDPKFIIPEGCVFAKVELED